jgi:hypothetical protein
MYNMSLSRLMEYKGVDPQKTLYDFMALEELAGNLFRVTQTTARVKRVPVGSLKPLSYHSRGASSCLKPYSSAPFARLLAARPRALSPLPAPTTLRLSQSVQLWTAFQP